MTLFILQHTTYEDYSLEGILKISWLLKHCEELPALVAFFFDLDWNDPQWDERQTECVSKVEVIRSVLFWCLLLVVCIGRGGRDPYPFHSIVVLYI